MNAAVPRSAVSPPFAFSRKSATTGKTRFASWFQTPVSVIARVTARVGYPQPRSIPHDPAIPTAAPPGATMESAVEACVISRAFRNPRPGSVIIHGGANVARLSTVAPTRTATHSHVSVVTTSQTSR